MISWWYVHVIKPILFRCDPERVHDAIVRVGYVLGKNMFLRSVVALLFRYRHGALGQQLWGIHFENPIGLAAGFDKNGYLYPIMGSVGFGHAEVGTVTYGAYEGNPKPRAIRLQKSRGLIINYGLKSEGAERITRRLSHQRVCFPRIISIGRTNSPAMETLEASIEDYAQCLSVVSTAHAGDIIEINISCPNLFSGAQFTSSGAACALLARLMPLLHKRVVWLKMPAHLAWEEFRAILDAALMYKVHAIVIANAHKDRAKLGLLDAVAPDTRGAVTGKPIESIANELIAKTYAYCGDTIRIVGVGGVFSAEDAYEKIQRGASLVQLITGMIYEGPQLIGDINRGLVRLLERDGFGSIQEAIGSRHR